MAYVKKTMFSIGIHLREALTPRMIAYVIFPALNE
jgi:hypothetical protein